jgi:predicted TIM-barrel fold metal-dependent hydrolase
MRKVLLCIAASFCVSEAAIAQRVVRYAGPIVDVHMHCYTDSEWQDNNIPNPVTGRPLSAKNSEDHFHETLSEMKRLNIVKGMISGEGYWVAEKWKQADPTRFLVGYGIDDPAKFDINALRKEIAAGHIDVIGEVDPQYWGYAPNDPRLDPIFSLAEEMDIPVGFHIHPGPQGAVYKGSPGMRQKNNSPLLLEDVIIKHPKLRLYVMHAGYPRIDEMINMLYAYPQLYVDIAVIDWTRSKADFEFYLKRLVDSGFGGRIMFGSDQMVWTDAIAPAVDSIQNASFLSERQKADIFYNNAVRFFNLDKKSER